MVASEGASATGFGIVLRSLLAKEEEAVTGTLELSAAALLRYLELLG